jgi:hypothetical protein
MRDNTLYEFFNNKKCHLFEIKNVFNVSIVTISKPTIWNNNKYIIRENYPKNNNFTQTKQEKKMFDAIFSFEKYLFSTSYDINDFEVFIDNKYVCSYREFIYFVYKNIKTKRKPLYDLEKLVHPFFQTKEVEDFLHDELQDLEGLLDSLSESERQQLEQELLNLETEFKDNNK